MKATYILIAVFLLITITLISLNLMDNPVGPHGGVVKQAGMYNIELKNSYPNLYAFLLDNRQRPISNKGISCDGKLIFADSTSSIILFKPFWEDGFSMKLGSIRYYACRINFNVSGKVVSALFDNDNLIAPKK